MEEIPSSTTLDGRITAIRFSLASRHEICKSSISDCPISHASQLSNPFLGLPLEVGKCESCGTSEPGQCEGHFGYIELPIPIYHPDHIGELKGMLGFLCLKCLKMKNKKFQDKNVGVLERMLTSCCEDASQVSINEVKTADGACYLELKVPARARLRENFWGFLEKYGYSYGDSYSRPLLPSEVMAILKKLPADTRRKLSAKGYFPQDGYILQYLPVPPNCLSVPDISDGTHIMSTDYSISLLKKVLRQIEAIKSSRSGMPNFESHHIEANDLQAAVAQYFEFRGTGKASRDVDARFGVNKDSNTSSTKAWLEKMKTLFIRKGSGFSSRSVITGDPYKGVNEIGLPFEIAQKISFEERASQHNMEFLQKLVDKKLCLTYRDGMSTYSLREGSKGHTFLRPGQVVHRRIMDGDMVFINRPPTTHKHSLQALSVYIHDDHTVKINPLICGPLSADFDGDCIHLFYPQSLSAKAEVVELFSVENQLLSSHTGNFNLQLATDSLLSLKLMFKKYIFCRGTAEQLAMFVPTLVPRPAVVKSSNSQAFWTVLQILQTALPPSFDCSGDRYLSCKSEMVKIEFSRDVVQSIFIDIVTSILFSKGPKEVLRFFDSLTPLLMENLYMEGFSVCLGDFYIPKGARKDIQTSIQSVSPLLYYLRSTQSESVQLQLENYLRGVKLPISNFVLKSSAIGYLIDSKSDSALNKVVQQIGFLGMQISDKGKFYTNTLVKDVAELFHKKYPSRGNFPSEEFGLVSSCLFYGLDPYQEMVHSISSREVIVRSTRGLTEPGTLFKNLMAILRDVVVCYDGTVRNVCSNSIIQFEYGVNPGMSGNSEFGAGEPVGVLAATAMSNPAYKAVLDSSPTSNSSWEMMKEILLCGVNFKNDISDRRVILYLNDCGCGRKYCRENAAYAVKNQLRKVSLKEAAVELFIEYKPKHSESDIDTGPTGHILQTGLIGHLHLNEMLLEGSNISIHEVLNKCENKIDTLRKKKKVGNLFKRIIVGVSSCCSFQQSSQSKSISMPCLKLFWQEANNDNLEEISHIIADTICPVLLGTVIKGDPRISTVDIIWVSPDTPTWIRSPCRSQKGELALDVTIEKDGVKQTGDAWRVIMDSCLPVIHLIDTKRSIPYAIKQVQEMLGISCAFEQAVQRLSTSVTMVTKGVLKDHLVLLANSMTCSGNLIGFNMGGIKALSRSLNVQVPFTEATLFAPRKCFERAAEKCHVDNLSSVVASCAWGKQVAVGTGSAFDILLDTRKVELNQPEGVDVYDFLHLVRGSLNGDETVSACIGAEIDDLDLEEESLGLELSPLRDSDKPTFEDRMEFEDNQREFSWEKDSSLTAKCTGGWEQAIDKAQSGGWDQAVDKTQSGGWDRAIDKAQNRGWDQAIDKASNAGAGPKASDSAWSAWGKAEQVKDSKSVGESPSVSDWGGKEPQSSWKQSESSSAWERKVDSSAWGKDEPVKDTKRVDESPTVSDWGGKEPQSSWKQSKSSSAWERKVDSVRESPVTRKSSSSWDLVAEKAPNIGAKEASDTAWSGWANAEVGKEGGFSKRGVEDSPNISEWGDKKPQSSWKQSGSSSAWGKPVSERESTLIMNSTGKWDLAADEAQDIKASTKASDSAGSGWANSEIHNEGGFSKRVQEGSLGSCEWGAKEPQKSWKQSGSPSGWGKKIDSQRDSSSNSKSGGTWDKADDKAENTWTKPKTPRPSGSDWKNKRSRPPKPADNSSGTGLFTKTRQRLDLFTAEEQDILADIEPIMDNIRRIMNQTGYNDGDPLSVDDQQYIVDNVLNHHPDKAVKIGAGVDYVMISKHASFQDSRCFYVISTDGHRQDFSYRKSLEQFIKEKYPEKAGAFVAKYFRKPQARPGWNRDRGSTPDEAGTPGWSRDPGTPGWSKDSEAGTPGCSKDPGTPGWGKDCEAGTPGWSKDPGTPAWGKDCEAGTPGWSKDTGTPGWGKESGGGSSGWGKDPGSPGCGGGKDSEAGTPGGWRDQGWGSK